MSGIELLARLRSHQVGKALPLGSRRNVLVAGANRTLLVVFLRMGGESIPWAVGYGRPGKKPTVLSTPEPRNRDLLAQMLRPLGEVLLEQLKLMAGPEGTKRSAQVWLPGRAHVEMLHHMALRYTFARRGEEQTVRDLNLLGRTSFALFAESEMPGSTLVMSAPQALRRAYTFPSEDIRQEHLGFLLPWLRPGLTAAERGALAHEAEEHAVSTSLDPAIERKQLEPLVSRWNANSKDGKQKAEQRELESAIHAILQREVEHRYHVLEEAIASLKADPRTVNQGLSELHELSVERLQPELPVIENGRIAIDGRTLYVRSPDSDHHPKVAAARLFELETCEQESQCALLHDDDDLQLGAVLMGTAIRGKLVEIETETVARRISWTIDSPYDAPLHLREGSSLCVAGCPKRTIQIQRIEPLKPAGRRFIVDIESAVRATEDLHGNPVPAASSVALRDTTITLVESSSRAFLPMRRKSLWKRDKPGDWILTADRPATIDIVDDEDA